MLPKKQKFSTISEIFFENYFFIKLKVDLAKNLLIKLLFRNHIKVVIIAPNPLFKT